MKDIIVKDIDENLYDALRQTAKTNKRSVNQEVICILQHYILNCANEKVDMFLENNRSANKNISEISESYRNRQHEELIALFGHIEYDDDYKKLGN